MISPHSDGPPQTRPWRLWGSFASIVLVTGFVFRGVLGYQFLVYDDDTYVLENPLIHSLGFETALKIFTHTYFRSYTPLTHLSHAVDFALWGRNPFGHHLTGYLLHLMNTGLVFLLALLIGVIWRRPPPSGVPSPRQYFRENLTGEMIVAAWAGAAFFALHPLRAESVAWISDRKDLLMSFFLLLSSVAYLFSALSRGTREGKGWYLLSFISAFLGMLAKSVASMFPLVLLLADAWLIRLPRGRKDWLELLKEKVPFFLGSLYVGIFSIVAVTGILQHPRLYERTALEEALFPAYTWAFYLGKTLWPNPLTPTYVYPTLAVLVVSLVAVVLVTLFCLLQLRRRASYWLLAWVFYALFLVPTILGRESAGIQSWADRYSYLPSVAIALLAGGGVGWLWRRVKRWARAAVGVGLIGVLSLLSLLTVHQLPIWHDTESLFRYAAATNPAAIMAHTNLGIALITAGKLDEAIFSLRKAIALHPRFAGSYEVMALAYEKRGDREKAIELYRKALSLDSNFVAAYSNLGNTFLELGRTGEAIEQYLKAIRLDPKFGDAYYNLGIAYYRNGDPVTAMEVFRRAVIVNPMNSDTYLNMGIIYSDWGDDDAALEQYRQAAELGNAQAKALLRPSSRQHP